MNDAWHTVPLGKVATLQRGYDLPARLRKQGNVPIITSSGAGDTHAVAMVTGPGVVTGRYGTIGEVFYITEEFWPLNTTLYVKDFHGNDPLFVSYLLRTIDFHSHSGKSGVPGVNRNDLHDLQVACPPLPEQRAIATALSDVDALIVKLDQLIAKKRDLKQAAKQQLLIGQTRLPKFNNAPEYKHTEVGVIPADWLVVAVEQLAKVGRGRVISHREIAKSVSPNYPVYSSQTSDGGVMGYLDTYDFEGEYITWTTDGANAGTVFYRNGKFNCTNVCGTIRLVKDNHVFVAKALAVVAPRYVSRNLGNPKLMNDVVKKILMALPPTLDEQATIATVLSDMDAEIAALEARRDKTRALKQGMMQELLTGRIRLV